MKSTRNWIAPLLMLLLPTLFFSCEEALSTEESEAPTTEEATIMAITVMEESGEMGCNGCFALVYPVTIELPDESTVAVDSREDMKAAIRAYLEANPPQGDRPGRPGRGIRPEIVFPYDVQLEDGSVMTITSREDLGLVLEACGFDPRRPEGPGRGGSHGQDRGLNHCFNLVFPVTLTFPDGTTSEELADRDALRAAVQAWKEANPDAEARPALTYPYDVQLQDETVVTVGSEEDRAALREACGGRVGDGHGPRCFRLNYPLTIELPGGETVEVRSREHRIRVLMRWRRANPDATERPSLVYPVSVTYRDGSTATANSAEELSVLREACSDE